MLRDKALLPFAGSTLLAHAAGRLHSLGFETHLAGSPGISVDHTPSIPDNYPDSGPLAGIEAALRFVATQHIRPANALFLPVDLPLLPTAFLAQLWQRAETSGALATIPFSGGRPQPLCAVYSSSLAPYLGTALATGRRKVMHVLAAAVAAQPFPQPLDTFSVEALLSATSAASHRLPPHLWFTNLNTPQDWQHLQALPLPNQSGQTGSLRI